MNDFVIQNFKYGLDTRRSELTSQPGTLVTCENAHITQGAEVEKRPGFFPLTAPSQLANTFGLEQGVPGLYTFYHVGAVDSDAGNLAGGVATLNVVDLGIPSSPGSGWAMAGIYCSTGWEGYPLVVAYYDVPPPSTSNDAYYTFYWNGSSFAVAMPDTAPTVVWLPYVVQTNNARVWFGYNQIPTSVTTALGVHYTPIGLPGSNKEGTLNIGQFQLTNDPTQNFASYQGMLAIINKLSIIIWAVRGDDLTSFAMQQILHNVGACAPFSVQSLGDLDVLMLDTTGVRSLRVRDQSLGGFVVDLGSPIDSLLSSLVALLTVAQLRTVQSVIEPYAKRYWLWIPAASETASAGRIYVLSYFPSVQITGWSTYTTAYQKPTVIGSPLDDNYSATPFTKDYTGITPAKVYKWIKGANDVSFKFLKEDNTVLETKTSSGSYTAPTDTAKIRITGTGEVPITCYIYNMTDVATSYFTPKKFVAHNGKIYVRGTDSIDSLDYIFGFGFDGVSSFPVYDSTVASVETPWYDAKTPATVKVAQGIDIGCVGAWDFYAGMAPLVQSSVDNASYKIGSSVSGGTTAPTSSTFDVGNIPFSSSGTHFKLLAKTTGATAAKLASLIFKFNVGHKT